MRIARGAFLALLVGTALSAGCMGGADDRGEAITASEVQTGFRRATGDELVVHEWEGLVGKGPPADTLMEPTSVRALERKYGFFMIVVYRGRVPAPKRPRFVDEAGVRWFREQNEIGYQVIGEKAYGGNVVLRWFPRPERMKTNAQWQRLNAALTQVTGARGG